MEFKLLALGLAISLATPLATSGPGDARRPADTPEARSDSCAVVLDSEVCTWIVLDGGRVTELGATVPIGLIESVPTDEEMQWPPVPLLSVDVPPEARSQLALDHMEINWEAHGHPPASFLVQHFDFHFYSISRAEVDAIDCADATKPASLPLHYGLPDIEVPGMGTLVGLCVPDMGMHAMPEPDIGATDPFGATMMLGYYAGDPIFFEPMVSRDLLLKRTGFDLPMPSVEGLPTGVHYPTTFRAEYDAASEAYRLIFGGFE
jgi:hypothetical protein